MTGKSDGGSFGRTTRRHRMSTVLSRADLREDLIGRLLYCAVALLAVGAANVIYRGGDLASYLAPALPTLAFACSGANLVRQRPDPSIHFVAALLMAGGLNAFFVVQDAPTVLFAGEGILLIAGFLASVLGSPRRGQTTGGKARAKGLAMAVVFLAAAIVVCIGFIARQQRHVEAVTRPAAMVDNHLTTARSGAGDNDGHDTLAVLAEFRARQGD